ncbi:hypothetical protein BC831DRAFT_259181 [Entophlyctis helioformis]|nr:hypothetical protein BC831DRAFT_259181 [Entophlyctis helioformis]
MSNERTATEHDASASPVFTDIDVFVQVSILATLCCAMCVVCITLSSRHLYSRVWFSKMPLISAISWFLSSLFLTLDTLLVGNNTTRMSAYSWLSLVADITARSMLLWFTYYRTLSIWSNAWFLLPLTLAIQLAQIAAWLYTVYLSLPSALEVTPERAEALMNLSIGLLSATDLLTGTIDFILISRMWSLNKKLSRLSTSRHKQYELVKPLFFYSSIVCLLLVFGISVAMAVLFATGLDPYFGFNTTLFAFRIFLTDIFSNLMRDSLIEAHAENKAKAASMESDSQSTTADDTKDSPFRAHARAGNGNTGNRWRFIKRPVVGQTPKPE